MANFLASIFGTELDKVNCSFYFVSWVPLAFLVRGFFIRSAYGIGNALPRPTPSRAFVHPSNCANAKLRRNQKIGACRHGDRCSRKHVKPSYSQTILMPNLYQNPAHDPKNRMNPSQLANHFDAFYEDIWCELCKYGELEELVVCDNNNDRTYCLCCIVQDRTPLETQILTKNHCLDLIGNVYARFKYEESAQKACDELNSRWYAARPIYCELSPVTDFREACCRLNSGEGCVRGGFCNFIHRKNPTDEVDREITLSTKKWLRQRGRDEKSVSRSPTPEPSRRRA